MHGKLAVVAAAAAAWTGATGLAAACVCGWSRRRVYGGSCRVPVGYDNGQRVGTFHVVTPDGSHVAAGTCDAFIPVAGVNGDVVDLQPFHALPASRYTLGLDGRSSAKTR